jgi:type I restriction enzyme R subunit
MAKRDLTEAEICMRYITPALTKAGWDKDRQIRREVYFTDGKINVRGKHVKRGSRNFADYMLFHQRNMPLAVVEAKDNKHSMGDGMQQALRYAETLDIPFVFTSNGDGFVFHDRTGESAERESVLSLDEFPAPEALWTTYKRWKGIGEAEERIVTQPFYEDATGKIPRYYQRIAINRTVEAIAKGQGRILLVMATGTGKTYTAFQTIWRLWKSGAKNRVLFLADRNILVDQTMTNDFKPFGNVMTKLVRAKAQKEREKLKSYEVYLALYQAVSGQEEREDLYKQFSPDFFDLIVVDECHRSSAREASAWHEILNYFSGATQIGLTATPKETTDVSNIGYFGEPIYTYSLKQGIEDGFLAPYRVVRVDLDKDLEGWRPEKGAVDDLGQEIEDRVYNQRDFDRTLVLNKRTKLVAGKVVELLEGTNPYAKTIVFCEDIDHATRMRRAITNEAPQRVAESSKYVMKITGDDNEGKAQLDHFIHPEERYPVIACTSRLMSTGVDAKTCEYIVLDRRVGSMTEFKQIIGRGTRIHEDTGKLFFTIVDFRKATEHFADPDFDGPPIQIYDPPGDSIIPPDPGDDDAPPDEGHGEVEGGEGSRFDPDTWDHEEGGPRVKYVVSGVEVSVVAERVQYYGKDGKLITESLRDYTRNAVREQYHSLDDFLQGWNEADRKQIILDELLQQGVIIEALEDTVGRDLDPFDLICHVVFDQPPLTRSERARKAKKADVFTKYGEAARKVLDALLAKYADEGIVPIEKMEVLKVKPLSDLGTPMEVVKLFGGADQYRQAVRELEDALYTAPAEAA